MNNHEEYAIKLKHVSKRYALYRNEKRKLLSIFTNKVKPVIKKANDDISLTIKKGEGVAVLGRNGAGKSTLLKIITGVLEPTSGHIEINGRVSALLELTAGFDMEVTGRENIYLRARLLGLKTPEIKELEESIIEFAEIGEYIDQPARTYSSGMRARLGFAINASVNPDILIVDEALSVGDVQFRKKCQDRIHELVNKQHMTVLLVTHSTSSAKDFTDRGIVLKDGKIIFDGSTEKAVEQYENL